MTNTLRKIALQTAIPAIAFLISVNAYVLVTTLMRVQQSTRHRLQAAALQTDVSNVLFDINEMETGQRGYLLTGDPSYLEPYRDADARLAGHLSRLRAGLAPEPSPEQHSLMTQLELVAKSKIAEMEETIQFRQQGYRHRAFLLVNTNRGKEMMEEARTALNALLSAQISNVARYDRELKESERKAYDLVVLTNCILLALMVLTLLALRRLSKRLERQLLEASEQLDATSTRVERLSKALFHDFRALIGDTRGSAKTLLEQYGGFLPRQGQEQVNSIQSAAGQMNRVLDELYEDLPSETSAEDAELYAKEMCA